MSPTWVPKTGLLVTARTFGRAVVSRVTRNGVLVQLPEFGGLEVELAADELTPLNTESDLEEQVMRVDSANNTDRLANSTEPDAVPLAGDVDARKSIEALRFGLVPKQGIEELTLGFADLQTWILSRFPCVRDGRPRVSSITGPFGTGKSHTMEVIRYLARREGYVVARVEVDGQTVSLSNPARLLHHLWATTAAEDFQSSTPLLDLYLKAINAGRPSPSIVRSQWNIDRIKHNYEAVQTIKRAGHIDKYANLLESLLSSSDEITAAQARSRLVSEPNVSFGSYGPKPMIGNRVAERPSNFVEVLVGHAVIARLAGYMGLIITIDEFEVEGMMSWTQYQRVTDLLDALTQYLRGDVVDYESAPFGLFFATVGDDLHEGDAAIRKMLGEDKGGYYHLQSWSPDQRSVLATRLHYLYCAAYGMKHEFDEAIVERIEDQLELSGYDDSGLIRAFIKRYIGTLDALYGPPNT